jgi:hypothetical protein
MHLVGGEAFLINTDHILRAMAPIKGSGKGTVVYMTDGAVLEVIDSIASIPQLIKIASEQLVS